MNNFIFKTFYLLIFIGMPTCVFAEWVKVGNDHGDDYFIDFKEIIKNGNTRKSWEVENIGPNSSSSFKSMLWRVEYQCKEEKWRTTYFAGYSDFFARGEVLEANEKIYDWKEAPPNSFHRTRLKLLCKN